MAPKVNAKRILVVDDHPLFRRGLGRLLEQEPDLHVCGEADDAPAALTAIGELSPDLVLADLSLKTSNGMDLIKDVRIRWPRLPVVVLSMHSESAYAQRVLRAGARGYITKDEPPEKIIDGIRQVLSGGVAVSGGVAAKAFEQLTGGAEPKTPGLPLDSLTDREFEIFRLIGQGIHISDIAKTLHLSIKTVETHRENVKKKLGLATAGDLLQQAILWVRAEG